MTWQPNMNRDQKKYVLELYQQGMTVRYCATTLDMSFTEIGRIIKEVGISFENTEL
jgi:DNA invertase Pin-like site-specific DNA recombinase